MSDNPHHYRSRRHGFFSGTLELDSVFREKMANLQTFKEMLAYDWDNDTNYQIGLAAILGTSQSPDQVESLTHRAQVFYWNREKNLSIDFNEYEAFVVDPTAFESAVDDSASADNPKQRSFAETVALIESGADVPNVRQIEPTVLKNKGLDSLSPRRRKPWEVAVLQDAEEEVDDEDGGVKLNEGTFGDHRDKVIQQELPDDDINDKA